MIGRTLAHYRIDAALGAGGMAEVFRATDMKLGREVALKLLPADMATDPERLERFRREAKALAALDHPGIVTVHSVEEVDGAHFLTMQLVEGESLDRLIPENGLAVDRLLQIAIALTDALAAAHEKGIVHRDLKPGNVMIGQDGRTKILDFGLAKIQKPGDSLSSEIPTRAQTREGVVMGTLPYMSPEQVQGQSVDHRTDVFSLGAVLYEMAAGRRPFQGRSLAELSSAILRDTPADLGSLGARFPDELTRLIARCLEKSPGDRFQSMRELHRALQALSAGEGRTTSLPSHASRRTLKLAFGLAAALGAGVFFVLGPARIDERGAEEAVPRNRDVKVDQRAAEAQRSVAVLPFVNLSGDPDQEYFSDGMAEEVLNALAAVPGLRVAARTSAFSFKGRNLDVRTIGEELDVAHVLEGSVRKAGSRLRIAAQLVSADNGYRVWSEVFDREMTDVFVIQEEIAQAIVRALSAQWNGVSATMPLVQPGTASLDAYTAYLRGRFRQGMYSHASMEQSTRDFEQAIASDPDYADAYGALALAYSNLHIWGSFDEIAAPLENAFTRALELNPEQPGGLVAKAWYLIRTEWDWRAAEELSLRAIEQDQRDTVALDFYAALQLSPTGRTDEAVALYRDALETDPFNTLLGFDLAWVLMIGGHPEKALVEIDRVLAATPDYPWGLALRAWALAESGRADEARGAIGIVPESDDEIVLMTRAKVHHFLREEDAAGRQVERLRNLAQSSPAHQVFLAWALILTTRVDEGLAELERALDVGSFQVPFSRTLFVRDQAVREHPRFQAILRRMRLDDASLREQGFPVERRSN